LLLCCSRHEQREYAKAPLATPDIRFDEAIYFTPAAPPNVGMIMDDVLHRHQQAELGVSYKVLTDLSGGSEPYERDVLKAFAHGLTPQQLDAYPQAKQAVVVTFSHPRRAMWRGLKNSVEVIEDAARGTGGVIFDKETHDVFGVDEWHRRHLSRWNDEITSVADHTSIHVYQDGEFKRGVTLGMKKFGLPDLVMTGFVASLDNQIGDVMNLAMQSMAEGEEAGPRGAFELDAHKIRSTVMREPMLESFMPNGSGIAHLALLEAKPDEGDPGNRLVEISSEKYAGNDSHAKLEAMISALVGVSDETRDIKHTDDLLAASRKAREHLPELRERFNKKLKPGESILVKAPFRMDDGSGGDEWMWVEVTRWDGDSIHGLLMNDPVHVRSLRAGQAVDVDEAKVFDYIHKLPDGRSEGNTTKAVIGKMPR
jgi:uncharacterized protein YegJ (DUF2314 family)